MPTCTYVGIQQAVPDYLVKPRLLEQALEEILMHYHTIHMHRQLHDKFPDSTLHGNAELGDNNQVAVALVIYLFWLGN